MKRLRDNKLFDLWYMVSIMITLIYVLFLVLPMFSILKESIFHDGKISFKYFAQFFSDPYYFKTIFNSFKISIATTFFSLLIGVPLAYVYNLDLCQYSRHKNSNFYAVFLKASSSC